MTQEQKPAEVCHVCGKPMEIQSVAACGSCGGLFHLAWNKPEGEDDCGLTWLDEETAVLKFMCSICAKEEDQSEMKSP